MISQSLFFPVDGQLQLEAVHVLFVVSMLAVAQDDKREGLTQQLITDMFTKMSLSLARQRGHGVLCFEGTPPPYEEEHHHFGAKQTAFPVIDGMASSQLRKCS